MFCCFSRIGRALAAKMRANFGMSGASRSSSRILIGAAAAMVPLALDPPVRAAEPSLAAQDLPRIPATEPSQAPSTFRVRRGFQLELVGAEPLVADPIAMAFDENGRLYVVEMRDYSERRDERLGTVRLLEDTNADGRFDKSSVFVKDLPWPTAVICYDGGVFVGATPDIYFCKDTNSDGAADVREVVFTGFGTQVERLNVQQLLNSFNWGLDNRIHGATAANGGKVTSPKHPARKPVDLRGRDFSFDPRTLELRPESGGGQHGLSFDDQGRKFVCSNSAHIQMLMYEDAYAGRNPFYSMPNPLVNIAADGPAAEVFRLSPDEPWRVIRTKWRVAGLVSGPIEGGGRPSGYFTGATGVTIYRGNAWPEEYRGDAFIADCGSNLIHRKKLFPDGVGLIAKRDEDELKSEFVASADNWFRPVQFANAPDGTLYVADMYREVIEHPWSLPPSIKQHLDLNSGNDRGRIYRIVPDGFKQPKLPRLSAASTLELVRTLEHPNGWHRDAAARLLYERQDQAAIAPLEQLLASANGLARMHGLYALDALRALKVEHLVDALSSPAAVTRQHAIRLSQSFLGQSPPAAKLMQKLLSLVIDPDIGVRYQLAFVLGEIKQFEKGPPGLGVLLKQDYSDPWMRAAILNSLGAGANYMFFVGAIPPLGPIEMQTSPAMQEFFSQIVGLIAAGKKTNDLALTVSYLAGSFNRNEKFLLARAVFDGMRRSGMLIAHLDSQTQSKLKQTEREAVESAADENEPEHQRIVAIDLLGVMDWKSARQTLSSLLGVNQPQPVQQAAITALRRFKEPEAAAALVKSWPQLTPRFRSEALAALISRPQQIPELLAGVERNIVPAAEFSPAQVQLLRSHREPNIQEHAQKLFAQKSASDRDGVLKQFLPALELRAEAARGRKIYVERCSSCHRLGQEGHAVGPDLASVKSSGKEKLLTSIIDPNREVPPNYVNYLVATKDGESLLGLIANENATSVTLRQAFGVENVILRSRIQKLQSSSQSMMPEGLEASLSPQEMADLLEFIAAGVQ